MRALWHDVTGGSLQGGSTITQQLVKNSYLNGDRSLSRKAKEAVLAIKLEQTHDKHDILERYLNIVYFGRGAYGIQAAAHVYFNTTAEQLNANQAAFLVGLLRSPETADPTTEPDAARQRRDHVTRRDGRQRQVGSHGRRRHQAATDRRHRPQRDDRRKSAAGVAPWFVDLVREEAIAQFGESVSTAGGCASPRRWISTIRQAAEAAVAQVLTSPTILKLHSSRWTRVARSARTWADVTTTR